MEHTSHHRAWSDKVFWIILGIYAVAVIFGITQHEPWRDEAQSFLVTRDNSLSELFRVLPSEGHPPLWYLVLFPFVKMGLPYLFQNWIAGFFMIGAAYIILLKTEIHPAVKLLIPFSYYFLFEFALFARSYCLVVFFLSLVIALYHKRFERPWLFALSVAALFNTHMLIFSFCATLVALYLTDAVTGKKMNKHVIGSFVLMCVFGLYLFPYIGMAETAHIFVPDVKNPAREIGLNISFALLVNENIGIGILLFAVLCFPLLSRTKAMVLLLGGFAGALYILGFEFVGSVRHAGILFLVLFAAYAISHYYRHDEWNFIKTGKVKVEHGYWLFAAMLVFQLKSSLEKYLDDIDRAYSDSGNAAAYIIDNNLQDHIIVGYSAAYACTVLPYLPGNKKMYYPEYPRFGSYYTNDSFYSKKVWAQPADEYVDLVKKNFAGKLDKVIFVFNRDVSPEVASQMELLYLTQEEPIFPLEKFSICRLKQP